MSGGAPGEEHERGRCGPCAECRAASRPARAPEGEHIFFVRVDDGGPIAREVMARTARDAAETFWRRQVMRGDATARGRERVVVEHERGSEVDPSVTWRHDEDGGPFVTFTVRVLDVQVAAEVAS